MQKVYRHRGKLHGRKKGREISQDILRGVGGGGILMQVCPWSNTSCKDTYSYLYVEIFVKQSVGKSKPRNK